MSIGYWALGCKYKTLAELKVAIMKNANYYESLPECNPPTPNGLKFKLGVTLFDEIPPEFEMVDENISRTKEYMYVGYPNSYSTVYTDVKNLGIYCRGLVSSFRWTADEYQSKVKEKYFTRTYKKTCFEDDTPFPPLASNEEVIFSFTSDNDRSQECANVEGKVQSERIKCKDKFRCVIATNECPIEDITTIGSFVNQKNNSLHQDINLLDSKLTLYHNSNYIDLNSSIARGWSVGVLAFYKDKKLYFGNGQISTIASKTNVSDTLHVRKNSNLYIFDKNLLHIKTKDIKSDITLYTFTYNNKTLKSIKDKFGHITNFEKIDDSLKITTPNKREFICQLDNNNNITSIKLPSGKSINYTYKNNKITQKIDKNQNIYNYEYKDSNIYKVTDPMYAIWTFEKGKFIKPEYENISYTHSYNNKILTSTKSDDSQVNLTRSINLQTNQTTYNKCDTTKTISYDTTKDEFEQRNLPKQIIQTTPSGLKRVTLLSRVYEKQNNKLIKQIDTTSINSKETKSIMDFKNHTKTIIYPSNISQTIQYDNTNSLIKRIKTPNRYDSIYSYNEKKQLTSISQGLRSSNFTYDKNANVKSITIFPSLRKTSFVYNNSNQVIKQIFPDKKEANYIYDDNGNLLKIITTSNSLHNFTYNKVNNKSSSSNPTQEITTYEYDKQRRLTSITKPSGKYLNYSYNNGKLNQIISDDNIYTYNYECDNLKSISTNDQRLDYSYDGNLLTTIKSNGILNQSINFTYNNDFLPSSITYANIKEDLAYNKDNYLIKSSSATIKRDKLTNDITNISDDTYSINYKYNKYGELTNKKSIPYSLHITRIGDKITSKSEYIKNKNQPIGSLNTYIYTYDKRGRVKSVAKDLIEQENYTYDDNSNLIKIKSYGKTLKATYDKDDKMLSLGDITYTYTLDGYLNTRTKNNQTTTYTYDTQGNLKEVKSPTKTINYIHNPNNQIIAKKINNEIVEKYLWHNLKLLAIYDKDDNLKTRYFYTDSRVPYKMIKNNKTYYLFYNQINSLKLIVDTKNNIIKKLSYDTYGNIIKDTNKDFNNHINYAGGFYDKDTKLIRFGKRDYFPEQRRWTAIDPIGFDGGDLNLYGYVLGNPVSGVDPWGLKGKKFNPTEKIVEKSYCEAWKKRGSAGCDAIAQLGHNLCLSLGVSVTKSKGFTETTIMIV